MNNRTLILAASAVAALSLAACNRPTDTANNSTTNTTADNSTQAPNAGAGANVASAVDKAQDTAAGAVGAASAATASNDANDFAAAAASSDMYEIKAAQIALERSNSPAVKGFARMMIHDHGETTAKLKAITGTAGVALPTDLDERRTGMLDNLKSAQGKDFDKTYLDQQIAAHTEALTIMKKYADKGGNPDLKTFASNTAPHVQMHLDKAKALDAGAKQGAKDNKEAMKEEKKAEKAGAPQ